MGRAQVVSTIAAAVVLGAVIAVIPDAQQRLSVDLWLFGVATWAGIGLARRALGAVPGERDRLRFALRFDREPADPEPTVPRNLLALEGTLLAAGDNVRTYDFRLRRRLRLVTAHRLRVNRGIDMHNEPSRAADALGDAMRLVDDTVIIDDDGLPPSRDDLSRLLDLSEADDGNPSDDNPNDRSPNDHTPNDRHQHDRGSRP